ILTDRATRNKECRNASIYGLNIAMHTTSEDQSTAGQKKSLATTRAMVSLVFCPAFLGRGFSICRLVTPTLSLVMSLGARQ
ncbi:hypothetical protein ACTXIX_18880, partial [Glutamicibacter ardleyensis]|uniref:hypothetical protein n=1 Tax=Glutamicibacter ardleyensis TaxID=225894 RepID=UPI003FD534AB